MSFVHFVSALFPLDGTVSVDGSMTSFVAENLEYKIKLASPVLRKGSLKKRKVSDTRANFKSIFCPFRVESNKFSYEHS